MKSDLDHLMQQNSVDALFITGAAMYNPSMVYMTGGGHVSDAFLFKKLGQDPVIFAGMMEREEAAKSGYEVRLFSEFPYKSLLEESGGDWEKVSGLLLTKCMQAVGLEAGKVAIYGTKDLGSFYSSMEGVKKALPDLQFIGYGFDPILSMAMMTKDAPEIERMKKIGAATAAVAGLAACGGGGGAGAGGAMLVAQGPLATS